MSASTLCFILGTTPSTMVVRIPNSLPSLSLLRYVVKPSSFSKILHTRPYTYPAIAAAEAAIESPTVAAPQEADRINLHPWPEWVSFVDRLKSQGYFPQTSSPSDGGDAELVYREMNLVKDPCLSFARDRYDIFGSLSKGDIQAIVEGGCPKILRKVINSAKRLRVYVGLDESDVCSACSLRGSCDRAYVTLEESEQDARTVDLVRLLLFYALDPLVISGALGSRQVDHVNSSARKLLRKLTDLSEASLGLAPLQPSVKDSFQKKQIVPSKSAVMAQNIEKKKSSKNAAMDQNVEMKKGVWVCPECSFINFSNVRCQKCHAENPKGENSRQVEMKTGDWNCPQCSFMNFSRNVRCRKCHAENPKGENSRQVEMKTGDWNCPECSFMNFSRNVRCRRCHAENPKGENSRQVEMKRGDWNCPQCSFMNFSRNVRCRKCLAENPKGENSHQVEMKRGDWNCPQCSFMNFSRNVRCRKCHAENPMDENSCQVEMKTGDWNCPQCDFLNFRRKTSCLVCGAERVRKAVSQYEDQFWIMPE